MRGGGNYGTWKTEEAESSRKTTATVADPEETFRATQTRPAGHFEGSAGEKLGG